MLPDWVLVFEELFCKCFVNYRDVARGRGIFLGNRTAQDDFGADGFNEARRYVAWPAPVSSLGCGSARPSIRMPSFQLSPDMGA